MAPQDLVLLVVAALAGWFIVVRPQKARARAVAEVRRSLGPGSRVMTTAGLHATVTAVEDDVVVLEIAPGVHARFAAAAVVRVLPGPDAEPAPDLPQQGAPPAD